MDVLILDGYNIIGAWKELEDLKRRDLELARNRLIEIMIEYKAYSKERVIIVFDALYVKGVESRKTVSEVEIIYTKESETADECIERLVKSVKNIKNKVYVATSDYLEQKTIFGRGALRLSARELQIEVNGMHTNVKERITYHNNNSPRLRKVFKREVWEKLDELRRGKVKDE